MSHHVYEPAVDGKTKAANLLPIAFFSFINIGLSAGMLNIAWTYMHRSFDRPLDALGILLGASTLGYMSIVFFNGRIIQKIGIGTFLMIGAGLAAFGSLSIAAAPTWELFLTAAFFSSMGVGMIDGGVNTFVSGRYKTSHLNWLHACFGIGTTIGPLLMTLIVAQFDQSWRWGYFLVGILRMILVGLLLMTRSQWLLPVTESAVDSKMTPIGKNISIRESLMVPAVILSILLFFMYSGIEIATGQLANTLFIEGRAMSQQVAGFWISIYWGSFTVGRMTVGVIASRFTNQQLVRIGMIGGIIGTALLSLNIYEVISLLGLVLMGASFAPIFPTLIADTPRRVGRRHAANAVGFQVGVASLGGAILPAIGVLLATQIEAEVIAPFLFVSMVTIFSLHEFVLWWEAKQSQRAIVATDEVLPQSY